MRKSRSRVSRRNYGIGKLAGSDVTDGADHVRNSSPFPGGNSRNQARIADIGSGKLFIARKSLDNSKSGIRQRIVGSNPTLSAMRLHYDVRGWARTHRFAKACSLFACRRTAKRLVASAASDGGIAVRRDRHNPTLSANLENSAGEVDERFKSHAWKACLG